MGFGCLFPPVEKRIPLGVLKNDFIFDGRTKGDRHSETWILGGAKAEVGFREWSDEKIVAAIVAERAIVFDSSDQPVAKVITRWAHAIPHYTVELENLLPRLKTIEKNVWLVGNYLGQIGLAKILERASKLPSELDQSGKWN